MRYLFLLMLLLGTLPCRGEGILPLDLIVNVAATADVANIEVFTEGAGTTESAAIETYIPVDSDGSQRLHYRNQDDTTSIPNASSAATIAPALIEIAIDPDFAANNYLHVASKRNGEYRTIYVGENVAGTRTAVDKTHLTVLNTDVRVLFKLTSACNSPCPITLTTAEFEESYYVYVFTSQTSLSNDTQVDINTYKNGIFYRLRYSNKFPTPNPLLTEVRNGDSSISVSYDAASVLNLGNLAYKTLLFQFPVNSGCGTHCAGSVSLGEIRADLGSTVYNTDCVITENSPTTTGTARLHGLTNGKTYWVSVSMMNKYFLTSDISVAEDGVTELMEVFLDKQACYLLSAGFGHEHWIIDYFRNFRDNTLAKTKTGRSLIQSYYHFSKPITPYIYNHAPVAWTVRQVAYVLWFVFAYPFVVLGSMAAMIGFLFFRRRVAVK